MPNPDPDELTTEEAAEHLRRLKHTLGPDKLQEAFATGGGLMDHEENQLRVALDVLGHQRAAEILGVEVPDEGLPGEQVTIEGEPAAERVPEERAEPVPEKTVSLAEFGRREQGDDDDDHDHGSHGDGNPDGAHSHDGPGEDCRTHRAVIERVLASARRQGELKIDAFVQAMDAAERDECIAIADGAAIRTDAREAAPAPTDREFDQLFEDVGRAFRAGGNPDGSSHRDAAGSHESPDTDDEDEDARKAQEQRNKRRLWLLLRDWTQKQVERMGLGPGALPVRDEREEVTVDGRREER